MWFEILVIVIALGLAGFAKGIVGVGLPPIAMGLLVLAMSPVDAAATMVIPALLTNVVQGVRGPEMWPLLRRFSGMLAATALATVALAGALSAYAETAIAVLGLLLVAYGLYSLRAPVLTISPRTERWLGPASGLATGAVTAFTGVSSMPSVPFLQSAGLKRDALIQAMGLSFCVSALALIIGLGASGDFGGVDWLDIGVATGAAFAGMAVGARLRQSLDERLFRSVFLWGLVALGLFLFVRSV